VLKRPSQIRALTDRRVHIQEKTERLLLGLQRLILLLDTNVAFEEEWTGISELANANIPLRHRSSGAAATI
jgi:hypothetical protein